MADYEYRKIVKRHWYGRFKYRRRILVTFVVLLLAGLATIVYFSRSNKDNKPTSQAQVVSSDSTITTFSSSLFRFQDTGKWVLNKQESRANKFIYYKFHGTDVQGQLIIYVNQVPIPLDLEVPRVLPVRIVNNDSLYVTSVSGLCSGSYAPGELHKVKLININGANMLCDPDSSQFKVVLAEINGDYQLHMQRKDGTPISFVITYRDLRLEPGTDSLIRVANTFQVI